MTAVVMAAAGQDGDYLVERVLDEGPRQIGGATTTEEQFLIAWRSR